MNFSKKLLVVAATIPFLAVVGCDLGSNDDSSVTIVTNEDKIPAEKDSSNVDSAVKDSVANDTARNDSAVKDSVAKDSVAKDSVKDVPTPVSSSTETLVSSSSENISSSSALTSGSSETPKSSSSYDGIVVETSKIKCNGFMWNGADDTEHRIDTECDAGGNTSGIWFDYMDSIDGGKSTLTWVIQNANDEHAPEFENCDGVCGQYTLDKGRLDYDPFVGVAFNLGGTDKEGNLVAVDATEMGGVCIQYSSDTYAVLEMGLTDEMDKSVGYALPFVDLGKSVSVTAKCFPWSKFRQPSWGKVHISGEEVAKALVYLRFRIQAKDGTKGKFVIYSIAPDGWGTAL